MLILMEGLLNFCVKHVDNMLIIKKRMQIPFDKPSFNKKILDFTPNYYYNSLRVLSLKDSNH